jgi:hypothetical protein
MNALKDFQIESQSVFNTIWNKLTVNNFVKYIIQGIAVAVAAYVIPNRRSNYREVLVISIVAALTFFTLDIFTDDVSKGAKFGAGFGIGLSLVSQTPLPQYLTALLV